MIELVLAVDARGTNRRNAIVQIDDVSLSTLSAAERHALIDAIALREVLGAQPIDPIVKEATVDAVREIVRARVARYRNGEESNRMFDEDGGRAALATWVELHGTANQRARLRENLLPPREALAALRGWLFADLDRQFVRFEILKPHQVCSAKRPRCANCRGRAEFENRRCESPIVADQYDELERIRCAVPTDTRVELREHVGACTGCTCRARRISARVVRRWDGFDIVREYQLSGPQTENLRETR